MLASALLHAAWNAGVKVSPDRMAGMAAVSIAASGICALGLPFVALPPPPAWPWLLLGVGASFGTQFVLARAYETGELGVAYPLTRGLAPVITTLAAFALFGEWPAPAGLMGIAAIALGVSALAAEAWRAGRGAGAGAFHTIGLASLAALLAAIYTVANARGVRLSSSALSFAFWSSVPNGLIWIAILHRRGVPLRAMLTDRRARALGGGLVATVSFVLILWATTQAPVALVSALRETAVLFGLVLATVWLKERLTPARIAAGLLILAGLFLLKAG